MLNIAPFPYFYEQLGDDPNAYIDCFVVVAIDYQLSKYNYFTTFPGNLVGIAEEWYANLNPRPNTWDGLRNASFLKFRPQTFQNHLMDRLIGLKMEINENIDIFYMQFRSLFHRCHNHHKLQTQINHEWHPFNYIQAKGTYYYVAPIELNTYTIILLQQN